MFVEEVGARGPSSKNDGWDCPTWLWCWWAIRRADWVRNFAAACNGGIACSVFLAGNRQDDAWNEQTCHKAEKSFTEDIERAYSRTRA
jgi:hypothetical protein